jgi:hypothetical protein
VMNCITQCKPVMGHAVDTVVEESRANSGGDRWLTTSTQHNRVPTSYCQWWSIHTVVSLSFTPAFLPGATGLICLLLRTRGGAHVSSLKECSVWLAMPAALWHAPASVVPVPLTGYQQSMITTHSHPFTHLQPPPSKAQLPGAMHLRAAAS